MSVLDELAAVKDHLGHDLELLAQRESPMVQSWAIAHSEGLFEELRKHRPIIAVHKLALVTKHADIVEVMASGMMDADVVTAPDEFRLDRPDGDYLDFGYGLHQCLGRYIARTLVREAVKAILPLAHLRAVGDIDYDGIYPTSFVVAFDPPARAASAPGRASWV